MFKMWIQNTVSCAYLMSKMRWDHLRCWISVVSARIILCLNIPCAEQTFSIFGTETAIVNISMHSIHFKSVVIKSWKWLLITCLPFYPIVNFTGCTDVIPSNQWLLYTIPPSSGFFVQTYNFSLWWDCWNELTVTMIIWKRIGDM